MNDDTFACTWERDLHQAGVEVHPVSTAVTVGSSWLDPQVVGRVLAAYRRIRSPDHSALALLTPRERDVLQQVGLGKTNAEAATALNVSEATVKSHLGHVLTKLDLRDRPAAIVFAHDNGLA